LFAKRLCALRQWAKKLPENLRDMAAKAGQTSKAGYQIQLAKAAQEDIAHILEWTVHAFGTLGLKRYEALVQTALSDLATDPARVGVRARDAIGHAICTYHLASSRKRTSTGSQVAKPRHLIIFRVMGNAIQVARVLHDAMDFVQHAPEDGVI
jgi:toxin ParE1/3/4